MGQTIKVLHLLSEWKWTGPAEPALEMIKGLRSKGIDAQLAVARPTKEEPDTVKGKAIAAGVPLIEDFYLSKHFRIRRNISDEKKLTKFIKDNGFNIVHCHRLQDHFIGGRSAKKVGVPVVRSSHDGVSLKRHWRNKHIMKGTTDLYLPVSQIAAEEDIKSFSLQRSKVKIMPPAIDTESFDPDRPLKDMREALNIPKDKILIGICARMQRHRRYEDLLDSWAIVKQQRDDVHFTIIGRGTYMEEVGVQPAKEKGLEEHLTFAGYHRETYIDMMNALDIKMFMMPGTDGSCRALRQALSLGIPAVSCKRGMIPEIVLDGVNGFVTDGSPEALAKAQLELIENKELREKFSKQAREISVEERSLTTQVDNLISYYEQLLK